MTWGKKKSKKKTGDLAEIWVRNYLISKGYSVHRAQRSYNRLPGGRIFMKSNDIFGCDIIAIKKDSMVNFIQVTRHSGVGKKLEELKKVKWNFDVCKVQIWQSPESGRWRVLEYNGKELRKIAEIRRGEYLELKE